MCEAMDAELLLGYLKWIRLNSAGSIRWWKVQLTVWLQNHVDTKERFSRYHLNRQMDEVNH